MKSGATGVSSGKWSEANSRASAASYKSFSEGQSTMAESIKKSLSNKRWEPFFFSLISLFVFGCWESEPDPA